MNKNKRYPALFMAPGVLIYGVFFILPVLIGVWYSFTNWNFTRADFVGLMNYKNIISDPSIKRALLNTIISLYYYLLVVKAMFINKNDTPIESFRSDGYTRVSLVACSAGILLLGILSVVYDQISLLAYGM